MVLNSKQSSAAKQRGQLNNNNLHWDEADPKREEKYGKEEAGKRL